ncbi:hypothetical protein FQA39_LY07657 [Lamprigera yunnana]|nr:hypothetical protein FQA39_LY07657 [Lamprigera yunnana]
MLEMFLFLNLSKCGLFTLLGTFWLSSGSFYGKEFALTDYISEGIWILISAADVVALIQHFVMFSDETVFTLAELTHLCQSIEKIPIRAQRSRPPLSNVRHLLEPDVAYHKPHTSSEAEHKNWTQNNWLCVMFADETDFRLVSDDKLVHVWRPTGVKYRLETAKNCGTVIFCGGIMIGIKIVHQLTEAGLDHFLNTIKDCSDSNTSPSNEEESKTVKKDVKDSKTSEESKKQRLCEG